MQRSVLVVDDEVDILHAISDLLEDEGYPVCVAATAEAAIEAVAQVPPLAILLDVCLKKTNGFALLQRFLKSHPHVPVLMMSGHGTLQMAVDALKKGAYDFIEKPFQVERLLTSLKHALTQRDLVFENKWLKTQVLDPTFVCSQVPLMQRVQKKLEKLAQERGTFLIEGASGVGKERFAREVYHRQEAAHKGHFVKVHAKALLAHNFESLFFGQAHEGFGLEQSGLLDETAQGVLFIEDIEYLHKDVQKKLALLLQSSQSKRGDGTSFQVKTRLVASTTHALDVLATRFDLRQDLLDRLAVTHIKIPPLRQRPKDIMVFVGAYLKIFYDLWGQAPKRFSARSIEKLEGYAWPFNVDEVRNVIEQVVIFSRHHSGELLELPDTFGAVPKTSQTTQPGLEDYLLYPLKEARALFEQQYLAAQVARFDGRIQQTAKFVGMERSALHRKMRLLNGGEKKAS
ncbi:MAG: sigma-54-dependent transcriptional regulator [Holosporaceae bacterium]